MGFKLDRIHVWSGEIPDQPGSMSSKLALLAQAGANLEFILTRRQPDQARHRHSLRRARYRRSFGPSCPSFWTGGSPNPVVLRVEGDNQAGLAHRLTQQWALAGINLQGLMMSVLRRADLSATRPLTPSKTRTAPLRFWRTWAAARSLLAEVSKHHVGGVVAAGAVDAGAGMR